MGTKESKQLVIDASVAGSCGGNRPKHPRAINCRTFLQTVEQLEYRIAMSNGIRDEWQNHPSDFATLWLARMVGKKRFVKIDPPLDEELWSKIPDTAVSEKQRGEMIKDILLLEAALESDRRVVSLDENTARKYFSRAAKTIPKLREIVWVNPDKPEEKPIEWLQAGAPAEDFRMLGYVE
jgi:hypothetical protein